MCVEDGQQKGPRVRRVGGVGEEEEGGLQRGEGVQVPQEARICLRAQSGLVNTSYTSLTSFCIHFAFSFAGAFQPSEDSVKIICSGSALERKGSRVAKSKLWGTSLKPI